MCTYIHTYIYISIYIYTIYLQSYKNAGLSPYKSMLYTNSKIQIHAGVRQIHVNKLTSNSLKKPTILSLYAYTYIHGIYKFMLESAIYKYVCICIYIYILSAKYVHTYIHNIQVYPLHSSRMHVAHIAHP